MLVRLTDGYELLASSHASLADGEQAARSLAAGGDWLDVGDGIVQRPGGRGDPRPAPQLPLAAATLDPMQTASPRGD